MIFGVFGKVMIEDNEVPVFLTIFSVLVNIEYLDFFLIMIFAEGSEFFCEFLNVFILKLICEGFLFRVISESEKAVLGVERCVKYASAC